MKQRRLVVWARTGGSAPADLVSVAGCAAVVAGGAISSALGGSSLEVAPHLRGTPSELLSIVGNNLVICLGLLGLTHLELVRRSWLRHLADVGAAVVLMSAAFWTGWIAVETDGIKHLPHAPLELAGVALAASWWWRHRARRPSVRSTGNRAALVCVLIVSAAVIETYAVPHLP